MLPLPRLTACAGFLVLVATPAFAQTMPTVTPRADGTILLSPFEVSTDQDTGYAAKETLAGTRMRTDLKDVGAALTILTPEFMRDLAVNSFDKALLYTASVDSVEGDNTDANRQSGTQMRFGTGQSYSIRGFISNSGEQSISHDFFTALDPTDNYNTEVTTLALGPNALLVGVGNPQGTAITTTKRALLRQRKTQLQFQADRWGSNRASLDHNQPLIKDQLAFRLNLLHDQKREFRKYEGQNQDRATMSLTYKPFANTKVTLLHENYSIGTNASSLMWGFNSAAMRWAAAGKPAVQFLPAGQLWSATRPYVDASGNRIPVAPGVVDADGFVDERADFDPKLVLGQFGAHTPRWIVGLPLTNSLVNLRYQANMGANTFGGIASANYQTQDPWNLLGLKRDANLNGGTWQEPSARQHGGWTQLLFEQKLATDLYLEVAGNYARQNKNLDPNNFTSVDIDINRYLPDGSVNPGYLVPFDDNNQMQWRRLENRAYEYRATLSYEKDLTKVSRWLGKHNLAGLTQFGRTDSAQDLTRIFNIATVGRAGNGWVANATDQTNVLSTRAYFLNGNVPILPDSNQLFTQMAALSGKSYLGATANEAAPVELRRQSFLNAMKSRAEVDARSVGWQARWLDHRLVTVLGVRQDKTKSFGIPSVRNVALSEIPGSSTDVLKQYFAPYEQVPFNSTPSITANGKSRTRGAVFHAFPWLSFTYSQSSNFLPVPNASWVNALGQAAPNSKGRTKDYGVRLSLLQGRLSVGVSTFEISAADQARNANASVVATRAILARLRTNYKTPGDSHFRDLADDGFYFVDTGNVADTWSYVAEGYELNVIFNPNRHWRMALTGSSNTNKLGDHLLATGKYLYTDSKFQGLGTWRKFASELNKVAAGQASSQFDLDPTVSAARTQAQNDAIFINQQADAQEKTYTDDQALTGITTARNGKYALNGLVTHVFSAGRLKGWSVGGNFRWRSAGTIGYQRLPNATTGQPTGIINVTKPLKGEEFWDVGAMLSYQRRVFTNVPLRVQLNVQNLPNWQQSRLVRSDYDTNAIYGTTNAIVPVLWEMRRPRNFILTSTFDF